MTQKMVFGDLDNFGNAETGPFWWSHEDQQKYKFDVLGGNKTMEMLVGELRQALDAHGVNSKGTKPDLVRRCNMHRGVPSARDRGEGGHARQLEAGNKKDEAASRCHGHQLQLDCTDHGRDCA